MQKTLESYKDISFPNHTITTPWPIQGVTYNPQPNICTGCGRCNTCGRPYEASHYAYQTIPQITYTSGVAQTEGLSKGIVAINALTNVGSCDGSEE